VTQKSYEISDKDRRFVPEDIDYNICDLVKDGRYIRRVKDRDEIINSF